VTRTGRLVFETHSLTVDNEQGIATGWLGGRLAPRGRALAAELGRRRRGDGIEAVFTSDLARAVETAEIAFGSSDLPVTLDWRLREVNYGELNGAPAAAVTRARPGRIDMPFPGGESYRDAVARVASFLDDLGRDRDRVLLIGHTATRWALDTLLAGHALCDVIEGPFGWREGWEYDVGRDGRALAGAPA